MTNFLNFNKHIGATVPIGSTVPNAEIINIGSEWLIDQVDEMTETIIRIKPSEFTELHRYLPSSVTSIPGPMRWDVNPYGKEIVDCFDVDSSVREVNLMKGVQITYTTILESGIFYYILHVKTLPIMYITADKELSTARVENNFIVMLNQSGFGHVLRSSDEGNKRKTGKTKDHLQWGPDGYLVPFGAKSANKMRSYSIPIMIKDELDGWPQIVGKDGDPDALSDARTKGYEDQKKIFRGSTPAEYPSKIEKQYLRGDQRKYMVKCLNPECRHPQELRWNGTNDEGKQYGVVWELNEDGNVIRESVRYLCKKCLFPHAEHDKQRLFAEDNGSKWVPTAIPITPHVRSYHLSALYSPIGMGSWYEQAVQYLKAWDPVNKKPKDLGELQVFYNNVLGKPFKRFGTKVTLTAAESHRRDSFHYGDIPNHIAEKYSGGPILFLTCQVDVHKSNLAVSVMGWTKEARCYLVDYWRFKDDSEAGCESPDSPAWERLSTLLEEKVYRSQDNKEYNIILALIDAGWSPDTVSTFCLQYPNGGVFPILGRPRTAITGKIKEFTSFKTQTGVEGFLILVDHYKDRMAPVLRRQWCAEDGLQQRYHFNTPIDATTKQLKELTVESRSEKTDDRGRISHVWYRPPGVPNELWDLLIYGEAGVEILAWDYCVNQNEMLAIDWEFFWASFVG